MEFGKNEGSGGEAFFCASRAFLRMSVSLQGRLLAVVRQPNMVFLQRSFSNEKEKNCDIAQWIPTKIFLWPVVPFFSLSPSVSRQWELRPKGSVVFSSFSRELFVRCEKKGGKKIKAESPSPRSRAQAREVIYFGAHS